ncbi:MAG: hypothetical protein KC454_07635 [Flavobacteriales bacterium]|nr:hypothetical protein [Flavobacteriales bacterium]
MQLIVSPIDVANSNPVFKTDEFLLMKSISEIINNSATPATYNDRWMLKSEFIMD